ncbi:uncharacterized protein LOC111620706 isoform X1 [Centruroides sculpturatus]|uniref:uncharacterized protein LOC111620706 isoform X1 n=2 Tax=Centruroides sculpturatus TaxID=218467 RepID=UPI000C6DA991|nr:uncharacterized protein LOC111620706 isoform X1 [Centruroides sculpturatus]
MRMKRLSFCSKMKTLSSMVFAILPCLIMQNVESSVTSESFQTDSHESTVFPTDFLRISSLSDNQSTTETANDFVTTRNEDTTSESTVDPEIKETEEQLTKLDFELSSYLKEELNRLSQILTKGDSRLKIPILDPLKLEDQIVKPTVSGESFDVHLRNIWISPLSSFVIRDLTSEIRESRIRLALYFPRLQAKCDIETNGTLFDIFTIHGRGNATIQFHEVHARTMIYLTREDNKLKVIMADQPFVDFTTSTVKFHGNDRESRKIVSTTVASQFGPLFFWMFSTNVVEILDYYMDKYINDALSKFDTPQVFNSLSIPIRYLRVHVPQHPIPYAYISPVYFHERKPS